MAPTTVLLVLACALLAGSTVFFFLLFRTYRIRYYAEAGRDPGYPIPTVELHAFDPVFEQGQFGTTPAAEALIIGKGPRVTGGTSDTEAWVLGALARGARTIFEFGTATGRTAYILARNAPPDARIHTITLHPDQVDSYRTEAGDHGKASRIARRESRFASFLYQGTPAEAKIEQLFGDTKTFDHARLRARCDLVFVDGSHAYSYVVSDSARALEMVCPGGIVLWHDYKGRGGAGADVFRALNELSGRLPLVRLAGTSFVAYRAD